MAIFEGQDATEDGMPGFILLTCVSVSVFVSVLHTHTGKAGTNSMQRLFADFALIRPTQVIICDAS